MKKKGSKKKRKGNVKDFLLYKLQNTEEVTSLSLSLCILLSPSTFFFFLSPFNGWFINAIECFAN